MRTSGWFGYIAVLIMEAALTAGLVILLPYFPLGRYPIPYVLLIMIIAYIFSPEPAILSIFLGWFLFTYFFVPPMGISWPLAHSVQGWAQQVALLLGVIVVGAAMIQARRSSRRLHQSEERFRTLFSTMSEGFALCEMMYGEDGKPYDFRYLEVNEAFEKLTGIPPAAAIGHTVREVVPGIEPEWIEVYGRVVTTGKPTRFQNYLRELNTWFEVYAYRLGNAWKFTSKQEAARIEVGALEQNSEKVYYVRDNGAGFNPDYADKLFAPFQRLHTESEFAGTGIGLALVQRIIRRHGGHIWAEGEVDKGAAFFFTFGEDNA